MDYQVLRTELQLPLYASMTDAQAVTELNAVNKPVSRKEIPAHEVFEAIAPAAWVALTADNKSRIGQILSMGTIDVQGANTRQAFLDAFPANGTNNSTRAALQALQTENKSRAQILGLGTVDIIDVQRARSGVW